MWACCGCAAVSYVLYMGAVFCDVFVRNGASNALLRRTETELAERYSSERTAFMRRMRLDHPLLSRVDMWIEDQLQVLYRVLMLIVEHASLDGVQWPPAYLIRDNGL